MSTQFNIKYPLSFDLSKKLVVNTNPPQANNSRIKFILAFVPLRRAYHPIYGQIFYRIIQSISDYRLVDAVLKFKEVLYTYTRSYMIINGIRISGILNRISSIFVDYKNI